MRRVATLVASGAPSAEVFSAVAREIAQVMHLPAVGVFRYDSDGLMTVIATWSDRPYVFQPGTRWPLDGQTMVAQVQRTGRPARVEDYTDLPGALAARARESGLNATAGAPIIVNGSVWGADRGGVAGRAAPRSCRGSARGVHRAGGNRDRQQPGPGGADAARGGAGSVAAGGDVGGQRSYGGRRLRRSCAGGRTGPAADECRGLSLRPGRLDDDGSRGPRPAPRHLWAWLALATRRAVDVGGGAAHRPPGADRGVRRRSRVACSRGARTRIQQGRWSPDHRQRRCLGSDLDVVVADRAASRACRGSARGVHRAGGNRDRQQPGRRGAHAARRGAGSVAASCDAGCSGRATGRGVRSRERGGGGIDWRGRRRAHALRGRRDRHCCKRLDDRGRVHLRREALRARRHRVGPDLRDGPARTRRQLRRGAGRGDRGRPRDGLALVRGSADHRRRPPLGRVGRRFEERGAAPPATPSSDWPSSPSSSRPQSRTARHTSSSRSSPTNRRRCDEWRRSSPRERRPTVCSTPSGTRWHGCSTPPSAC